jgi:hypothetical protein
MLGEEAISSVPRLRAGLFSDLSAWDSYPLRILDCVELRVPPLISHEKTAPSHQSLQKGLPPEPSCAGGGLLFLAVKGIRMYGTH